MGVIATAVVTVILGSLWLIGMAAFVAAGSTILD